MHFSLSKYTLLKPRLPTHAGWAQQKCRSPSLLIFLAPVTSTESTSAQPRPRLEPGSGEQYFTVQINSSFSSSHLTNGTGHRGLHVLMENTQGFPWAWREGVCEQQIKTVYLKTLSWLFGAGCTGHSEHSNGWRCGQGTEAHVRSKLSLRVRLKTPQSETLVLKCAVFLPKWLLNPPAETCA